MPKRDTNHAHTVAIDSTGEIATFDLTPGVSLGARATRLLVELYVDASAAASFAVEFGTPDATTGDIVWFDAPNYTYASTDTVRDSWYQSMEHVRLVVTAAAPANSEATVCLIAGN